MAHVHSHAPLPLLADHLTLLSGAPEMTALDVACGAGRNALFLADNGFAVTGVERNEEAIATLQKGADDMGVTVQITPTDLEQEGATLPTGFGVVCVSYYLYRPLLSAIREAVMPGGFVLYESFLIDQHERWGHPRRADFAWGHNEMLHAFDGFRIHHYAEVVDAADESAVSRIVAQRI